MAKTSFGSVDEYIASLPPERRATMRKVRSIVRKALPKASEVIAYQIAAYKVDGKAVLYFAGFKHHYSLYPATAALMKAMKKELTPRLHSHTLRFSYDEKVPAALITRIAKLRAAEVRTRAKKTP